MREIQETEAKAQLTELLHEVEGGESIAIIRDGKKVAALVPVEQEDWIDNSEEARERRRKAVEEFMEARKKWKKVDVTLEELMDWRHEVPPFRRRSS